VRELENVIGRAAVTSTGNRLELPEGWHDVSLSRPVFAGSTNRPEQSQREPLTLEQFEKTRIIEVLHQTNWRIEGPRGAALVLGLHPNTLRSRMHKLGIERPSRTVSISEKQKPRFIVENCR
jgi:transcriptional regulator with GAF, ATPase, and Fis domain